MIAVALAVALLWLVGPVQALARGWLLAFAVWSGVPIGSLVLLMIHTLVGGRWGRELSPVLRPFALLIPIVLIAFVPIAAALPAVYPWLAASRVTPSVSAWYLNTPAFFVRAAIALSGWSILGIVFGIGRGTALVAALGLAFHGLAISVVAVDWYLSLTPAYVSTAFAAMIAIQQILSALVAAALICPRTAGRNTRGDLGGLLIAATLGTVYMELMIFIVAWYGDLPDQARWYLDRVEGAWLWLLIAAVLVGAVLPFGLLLVRANRRSRSGLRLVGALLAIGVTLHFAWLIVPSFESQIAPALAACGAALGLAIVSVAVAGGLIRQASDRGVAGVG